MEEKNLNQFGTEGQQRAQRCKRGGDERGRVWMVPLPALPTFQQHWRHSSSGWTCGKGVSERHKGKGGEPHSGMGVGGSGDRDVAAGPTPHLMSLCARDLFRRPCPDAPASPAPLPGLPASPFPLTVVYLLHCLAQPQSPSSPKTSTPTLTVTSAAAAATCGEGRGTRIEEAGEEASMQAKLLPLLRPPPSHFTRTGRPIRCCCCGYQRLTKAAKPARTAGPSSLRAVYNEPPPTPAPYATASPIQRPPHRNNVGFPHYLFPPPTHALADKTCLPNAIQ